MTVCDFVNNLMTVHSSLMTKGSDWLRLRLLQPPAFQLKAPENRCFIAAARMTTPAPRVVVLRGPASSGKSTVSAAVVAALRARGVRAVYLEQDFFRNTAAGGGEGAREVARDMLVASARAAHAAGFCVIMEGILNRVYHVAALTQLGLQLPLVFVYLDVRLEETKIRHEGRHKSTEFDACKLDEWWQAASPMGVPDEVVVCGSSALQDTVDTVVQLFLAPASAAAAAEDAARNA